MKKLMIAAVAATMTSVSMADISIKGDGFVSFATNNVLADIGVEKEANQDRQRVRLHVVGSTGNTKVTAIIRNNGNTGDDKRTNGAKDSVYLQSLYFNTKVGPVDIKAGDFRRGIGFGSRIKSAEQGNAFIASTKVNDWTLGVFTNDGSKTDGITQRDNSTSVFTSGKLGPVKVSAEYDNQNFANVNVKTTVNNILFALEQYSDKTDVNNDTTLIHVGGKVNNFKWDVAQLKNDNTYEEAIDGNKRFAPLGSMLIGKVARGGTDTAVANVGDFTKIKGIAVSTKMAGNTIKAIYTRNTLGDDDKLTGAELILTRPLAGAKLTVNLGKISGSNNEAMNTANTGFRIDVRF